MTASMRGATKAAVAGMALAASLSGCAEVRNHQGYVVDRTLVASVEPGVDNRDSVQATLGDPSFASQFDDGTWYYVSRSTKQFSFGTPKPVSQLTLAVHFDKAGLVTGIDRSGLELASHIHPVGDKTPTLGRTRSLFQELFGNIGAVGSAGMNAPTTDNPTGGGTNAP
ncbi:outer membrane protein assembly factor BamE [Sphingomonas abietis]|uniref:Outer membrane protein assembly factor BamE n=1 Tax=Sphingomonas abietis TaxID=3012344 RepID=A0ABY7NM98_9SPHN|nr:outer membrane protein assembly factor BamE [Sphingomonas abietis]WBO22643.1 outer membrane protein assembly factor BamE [Sphingomonas abietis]